VVKKYDTIVITYDNIIDGIVVNLTCDTCKGKIKRKVIHLTLSYGIHN